MTPIDALAAALALAGAGLALTATLGLHRLPDLYARMHAATKPTTLGLALLLGAAALRVEGPADRTKLLLAIALQLVTAPTAAHLLSRAAHRRREPQSPRTVLDEIATDPPTSKGMEPT
ncbi:MAG TPA: monovalent cation/H(+) antiporter subunit G [Acidimicrobiales bacterium]|nr:monovalent cation/H(+) antiporter subunit G [Acidimicrobiales bacterium]